MQIDFEKMESKQLVSKKTGEFYSKSWALGEALGFKNFSLYVETLEAGRRLSASHYHSRKKELIFVLEGSLLVMEGGQTTLLEQGEMYFFSPIENVFHSAKNTSKETAKILLISEGEKDIVFYEEEGSSSSAEG